MSLQKCIIQNVPLQINTKIYPGDRPEKDLNGTLTLWPFEI